MRLSVGSSAHCRNCALSAARSSIKVHFTGRGICGSSPANFVARRNQPPKPLEWRMLPTRSFNTSVEPLREWTSSAGASLTFSLSLPLQPVQWGGLSLAVGLALAEALEPGPAGSGLAGDAPAPPRLGLKWPNDLWLLDGPGRGRKLGGVLIETVTVGQHRLCVVGVGLNVLPQPAGGAQGLASGYACLQELDPGASAPAVLARVTPRLARALRRFEAQGFAPLVAAYQRRDLLRGQTVSITVPEALQGTAEGVDDQGALLVRSGALHRVVSGEVSVRLGTG